MREGFIATCKRCGAPHSLALLDATAPCAHCRAVDPLEDNAQARVEQAAEKVCRLAHRAQQQERTRDERSGELGLMAAAFAIPSWLLFGGIALAMVYSEKPERLSLWDLLHTEQIADGNTAATGAVLAWWLLFLIIAGVELSLFTVFASLFYLRKPFEPPKALPPLDAQSPPRCHLCGAGLTSHGLTRRCRHCGTNNLVDGRSFDAQITAMHEQLSVIDHAVDERSAIAGSAADKVVMASAFYPITLLLALPLGLLIVPRSAPELLPALAALGALVALSILAWLSRWKSHARHLSDSALGSNLRIKGRAYVVSGRIDATAATIAGAQSLAIASPLHNEGAQLAVDLWDNYGVQGVRAFELRPGGVPYAPDPAIALATLSLQSPQGPATAQATQEPSPRIFTSVLNTGAVPTWTLHPLALAPEDLLLV